ncbi:hypothetical protein LEP1GSC192_1963 [Leptospira sp. B5-022]|nr:hypothetical protein LEP1GSC192_1963 [Leptospira sp. B5-022]
MLDINFQIQKKWPRSGLTSIIKSEKKISFFTFTRILHG